MKITKLHFNGVDYDIGDKDIHDLTEKQTLSPNDELIVSDSNNIYQNKKVKFRNILGYENGVYVGNINKGDVVSLQTMLEGHIDYGITIGHDSSNYKLGFEFYGNGNSGNCIYFYLRKEGTPGQYTVRIETDNNGEPSGTLANANATGTIDNNSLSTSRSLIKVDFVGDFTLSKGTKYWVVIVAPSIDSSNYIALGLSSKYGLDTKGFDNSTWSYLKSNLTLDLNPGGGKIGNTSTFTLNITPTANFTLISIGANQYDFYISGVVITNNDTSTQIYSGPKETINVNFERGVSYSIVVSMSNGFPYNNLNYVGQFGTFTGTALSNGYYFIFNCSQSLDYKVKMDGNFIEYVVGKVDTTNIATYSDSIGVALQDGVKGDLNNIVINGGIIQNNSRDLKIGHDYYYINNTLTDTYIDSVNMVYIGKAISNTEIKVDIKKALYGLSSDIAPFTGLISGTPAIKGETVTGTLTAGF